MPSPQLNSYKDVQDYFNNFVAAHSISIDDAPHGAFWNSLTYDEFVNGPVRGISAQLPTVVSGNSAAPTLIRIRRGRWKVGGKRFPQMPGGGPFMKNEEIAPPADWIARNCPTP